MYDPSARLIGNIEPSRDVQTFMSSTNVKRLQRMITKRVHDATGGKIKIDDQPEMEIRTLMVDYLNRNENVNRSLAELNEGLAERCAQIVLGNVSQYLSYMRDRQNNAPGRVPEGLMQRPANSRRDTTLKNPVGF